MSQGSNEISIGVRELGRFLFRGAGLALVLAAAAAFGAYQLSSRGDPEYRAEATVLAVRSSGALSQVGLSSVTAPPIDASAYQAAGESDAVLMDALQALGVMSPSDRDIRSLRGDVSIAADTGGRDSLLLIVEADGSTPELASSRANAVANALVEWDARRARESLGRAITALDEQITALGQQIRSLQALDEASAQVQIDGLIRLRAEQQQQLAYARALVASAEGLLSLLQPAGTTPRQVAPRPLLSAIVAALLAIVVAYALLILRVAFSSRLRSVEDIEATTGAPIFAQLPKVAHRDDARLREAASYLRTNLLAATIGDHPRVFMVTSASEKEGKTTVAMHLAEGLARNGYRTLLVDADLRSPAVARHYPLSRTRREELSTEAWLRDPEGTQGAVRTQIDEEHFLDLIPQFRASPAAAEMLPRGMPRVLAAWGEAYDAIVIDTPPLGAVADALNIAPHCTSTLLVVDRQRTDRPTLARAVELLGHVSVGVLGVVVNRDARPTTSHAYGYGQERPRRRTDSTARLSAMADGTVSPKRR